ncbi:DUF692 domain-containing protein [Streptacidiphilus pinicola]|uniref:DUF692 domain-containing protein n=1 Tax=Streptacidiphilus pinicola TaxID=2219663 RepID=A0A2X0K9B5_9ACTN|nr:DUF692 domain-containing protein [Streptacidiphilus pinicola]RAG83700.1 DUF692 domain-containing protein [Streptacidiphilus pinicola]
MSQQTPVIPAYGVGIGYRIPLAQEIDSHADALDVVELLAEQWFGNEKELSRVCETHRTVLHGVGLSVASAGGVSTRHLRDLRNLVDLTEATYVSEHLALTRVPGLDSGHLCPVPIDDESLRCCTRNVLRVQEDLGVPLALENITFSVGLSRDPIAGAEFLADLARATGCLILLDVANLYINSANHGFDVVCYLDRLPLDRVAQIHLAGGTVSPTGKLIDSHSEAIEQQVWDLSVEVARRTRPSAVIIEHDANFPALSELISEVDQARAIFFPAKVAGSV